MKEFFRIRILPVFVWLIYTVLRWTWRVTLVEPPAFRQAVAEKKPIIIAHYHQDAISILYLLTYYHAATMASSSKDGELIAGVIRLLGGHASRGSTSRNAVSGLKGLLRYAKQGYRPCIAVDGPKGPAFKVKPGVFEIAKVTQGLIFPLTAAASRPFIFPRSWDESYLPKPFSRFMVVWGDPVGPVDRDADGRSPELAESLERSLSNAKQMARNLIATHSG